MIMLTRHYHVSMIFSNCMGVGLKFLLPISTVSYLYAQEDRN